MEIWPNFFIVGAPRAGTTSMYEFLKRTPGVYMASMKEPHYFSCVKPQYMYGNPIRDKKKYLSLFNDVTNEIAIGEASTSYLWDPHACKSIHENIPKAQIVIMLRDPIQRAFSHYLMRVGGGQTLSFSEVIRQSLKTSPEDYYNAIIVNGGFYAKQVKRYFDTFDRSHVKIIIFEEFIQEPKKAVKELLKFLKVDSEVPDDISTIHNEFTIPRGKIITSILRNKIVRRTGEQIPARYYEPIVKKVLGKKSVKPKITLEDRIFLEEQYMSDVKELQEVLDRELPWNFLTANKK